MTTPTYDRELIACMLETAAGLIETFNAASMQEQANLLRAADNADAAGVRVVNTTDPVRALIERVAFALPGSIPTIEKAQEVAERVVKIVRHALAQQPAGVDGLVAGCRVLLEQYEASGDFTMGGKLTNRPFMMIRDSLNELSGNSGQLPPCRCGDGPYHYRDCPHRDPDFVDPFAALGAAMSGRALAQQPEAQVQAWMDPSTLDVIHADRKKAWAEDYGAGGKAKAAAYTVPLYTAPQPAIPEGPAPNSGVGVGVDVTDAGVHVTVAVRGGSADTIVYSELHPFRRQPAIPEGWVLAPKEPTGEMVSAGILAYDGKCESSYRAMLAAAQPSREGACQHQHVPDEEHPTSSCCQLCGDVLPKVATHD